MSLVTGLNHVAVVTADLDRFINFYTDVFDMSVVFQEATPAFRHVILHYLLSTCYFMLRSSS
jgi:catechol 2,3-dioxygenase-like lactoylglutathione lyase family enzyme